MNQYIMALMPVMVVGLIMGLYMGLSQIPQTKKARSSPESRALGTSLSTLYTLLILALCLSLNTKVQTWKLILGCIFSLYFINLWTQALFSSNAEGTVASLGMFGSLFVFWSFFLVQFCPNIYYNG